MTCHAHDILVFDANVLMNNLDYIKNYLIFIGNIKIAIPWIIIEELEGIKKDRKRIKSSKKQRLARIAIKWLNDEKNKENSKIIWQTPQENERCINRYPFLNKEINDDKVICCSLYFQESNPNTILFTNDIGLQLKA